MESPVPLVDQLRAALDRAEEIARAGPWVNVGATANQSVISDPGLVLRTIKAHREILDGYIDCAQRLGHWTREGNERYVEWAKHEVNALQWALDKLAAIYFPESGDTPNGN